MAEELKEVVEKTPEMEQIEDLMAQLDSKIDKEEFDKLNEKYKKLLKNYTERRPAEVKKPEVITRKASDIAKELRVISDGDITNRGFIEKSLEYRNAYMAETGKDCWTDFSKDGSDQETEKTKKIAKAFRQLLDENPNPVDFRIKFHQALRDDANVSNVLRERSKNRK